MMKGNNMSLKLWKIYFIDAYLKDPKTKATDTLCKKEHAINQKALIRPVARPKIPEASDILNELQC